MSRSPTRVLLAALRREPPDWALSGLLDLPVIELAEVSGVLPVVADVAVRHGLIPDVDAPSVLGDRRTVLSPAAVLLAARQQNRARHADLDAIRDIARAELDKAGIGFRHLKGGALRSAAVWHDFGARPTRDVDILVADAFEIPRIESALLERGFVHSDDVEKNRAWEDDHHDRPLVWPGRAGSLELHAASLVRQHRGRVALDIPAAGESGDLVTTLRHIIVHAQLQDDALLQGRLPLVALLDVAFAIENGLVTAADILHGWDDRLARKAARVHLGQIGRLRDERIPGGKVSALRWAFSSILFGRPRLAHVVREAVFAPRALSRPVMSAREGRELGPIALAMARWRFLLDRVPRGVRSMSDTSIGSSSASRTEQTTEERTAMAPTDADEDAGGTELGPARRNGFEAVWSSSGLVLVDLGTDVLHHLNGPAAVVYELVGGRSLDELIDAFAALADEDRPVASSAVTAALDALADIDAIAGWPPA